MLFFLLLELPFWNSIRNISRWCLPSKIWWCPIYVANIRWFFPWIGSVAVFTATGISSADERENLVRLQNLRRSVQLSTTGSTDYSYFFLYNSALWKDEVTFEFAFLKCRAQLQFSEPAHCSIEFSSRSPSTVSARSCGRRSFGRNLAAKKHKRWKERECDFCLFGLGRLPIKPLEQGHGEKWWDVPCVTVQMRVSGVPRSYSPLTFLISIPLASVITGLEAGAVVTPKKDTLWLFTIILFWTSSCSKKPPVEKFISTPISKWNWLEQKIVFWLYLWRPGECGSV